MGQRQCPLDPFGKLTGRLGAVAGSSANVRNVVACRPSPATRRKLADQRITRKIDNTIIFVIT
jgi:hypothetical protein